jgi:DNA gyrase subunit A
VSVLSRNTQGVRLIKLKEGERMQGLERIEENVDETAKRELARAEAAEGEEALEADDGVIDDVADDIVDDATDDSVDE